MGGNFCFFLFAFVFNLHDYVPSSSASPIIKGVADERNAMRYHVSVHIKYPGTHDYRYTCGGSIIRPDYVLSAGNCFNGETSDGTYRPFNVDVSPTIVRAGTNKRNGPGMDKDVEKIFIPEISRSHQIFQVDLAILKLRHQLEVNTEYYWTMINFSKVSHSDEGSYCGFGKYKSTMKSRIFDKTKVTEELSDINRCASVRIMDAGSSSHDNQANPTHFNAMPLHKSEGIPCPGDEGAGLIQNHVIVGILTGRLWKCLSEQEPLQFTNLWTLRDYIRNVMIYPYKKHPVINFSEEDFPS